MSVPIRIMCRILTYNYHQILQVMAQLRATYLVDTKE